MIGKKFMCVAHKNLTWSVEVINESDTHYTVRVLSNDREWEESKNDFSEKYQEIIKLGE